MRGGEVSGGLPMEEHSKMEHGFREHKRLEERIFEKIGIFGMFLKCYTNVSLGPLGLSFIGIAHNSKYL